MQMNNTVSFSAIQDQFSTTQFPYHLLPHTPISNMKALQAESIDGLLVIRESEQGAFLWFPENPYRFPKTPITRRFWERIRKDALIIGHVSGDNIYIPPLAELYREPEDYRGRIKFDLVSDLFLPNPDMCMDICTPLARAIGKFDASPSQTGSLLSMCAAEYLAAHEAGVSYFVFPFANIGFCLTGSIKEDRRTPAKIQAEVADELARYLPPIALLGWSLENNYTPQSLSCQVLARTANAALAVHKFWPARPKRR